MGVVGPIAGLARDGVVAAVRRIADIGPRTRVAVSFVSGSRRWQHHDDCLDSWCDDLVIDVSPATPDAIVGIAAQQVLTVSPQHPLRFVVAGDYLIEVGHHAPEDGKQHLELLITVANLATGSAEDLHMFKSSLERLPLWKAVRATFINSPRTCRALFATRRLETPLRWSAPSSAISVRGAQDLPWPTRPLLRLSSLHSANGSGCMAVRPRCHRRT
ncbi:MAG: hypothetical protein ABI382_06595 [Nakamurella sp.]